jgi:hypothetical protein
MAPIPDTMKTWSKVEYPAVEYGGNLSLAELVDGLHANELTVRATWIFVKSEELARGRNQLAWLLKHINELSYEVVDDVDRANEILLEINNVSHEMDGFGSVVTNGNGCEYPEPPVAQQGLRRPDFKPGQHIASGTPSSRLEGYGARKWQREDIERRRRLAKTLEEKGDEYRKCHQQHRVGPLAMSTETWPLMFDPSDAILGSDN